jgi:diguanylate cyclase (GGDEF)-like protein
MNSDLHDKLNQLRQNFVEEYNSQLANLINLWREVRTKKLLEPLEKFLFELHKLRGSAGALNFSNLSNRLELVEQELISSKKNVDNLTPTTCSYIDRHLNELITAAKTQPNPMLLVNKYENPVNPYLNKMKPLHSSSLVNKNNTEITYHDITIGIINEDREASELTAKVIRGFGFDVTLYHSLQAFSSSNSVKYKLVIIDMKLSECAEKEAFELAKKLEDEDVRVFIQTSSNKFESRLASVRADVSSYLLKPVDVTHLVGKIREAFDFDHFGEHRVLLLDDQEAVGIFYKTLLEDKGFEVLNLDDANYLMTALESFSPDIFLLNFRMPEASGIEVAQVIRQQVKFDYVPIIFLTSDSEIQTKLSALECGADDIIAKDTSHNLIANQIESRIKRGQKIRYLASRDSLTGVLNHGQIMEAANHAFRLAERATKTLIVAMIDVDFFKKVNDTHGHASGDKVLVSLGQLLIQSVRSTDYVGRYGGEEFMLVFVDSDLAVIEKKVNAIRESFNHIAFKFDETPFSCSFSAGIASSKDNKSLNDLICAADQALYKAKEQGRNRVILAGKTDENPN